MIDGSPAPKTGGASATALAPPPDAVTVAEVRESGRKALVGKRPMTRVGRAVEKGARLLHGPNLGIALPYDEPQQRFLDLGAGQSQLGQGHRVGAVDAVLQERAYEFMLERRRFFDLKRTGKVKDAFAAVGKSFIDERFLFPIPESEINNNPALSQSDQNPGY